VSAAGDQQLREALRRWRSARGARPRGGEAGPVVFEPACTAGVLNRDAIEDLAQEVEDLRDEVRWVRTTIIATIVTAAVGTVIKLAGW
jgi:hypothetical protein